MKRIFPTLLTGVFMCLSSAAATAQSPMKDENPALTQRQKAIAPIAAFTASGDMENLKRALAKGLDDGLSVHEIKEVLVQLYAYAGFPRSLNAIGAFMAVLDERKASGIEDIQGKPASPLPAGKSKLELGTEVQTFLVGAPVKGALMDFAPAIDLFLKEHLFGDIFGRDNLDYFSREVATVAALSSIDSVESQLRSHLNVCLNIGLTAEQLRELINVLKTQVGAKQAARAEHELESILNKKSLPPVSTQSADEKKSDFIFEKGDKASSDYFTGTAWVKILVPESEGKGYSVGNVVFESGARNHWHTHDAGQILLVTQGRGFYQERGKPARLLLPGTSSTYPRMSNTGTAPRRKAVSRTSPSQTLRLAARSCGWTRSRTNNTRRRQNHFDFVRRFHASASSPNNGGLGVRVSSFSSQRVCV